MVQSVDSKRDSLNVMSVLVYVEVPMEAVSSLEDGLPDGRCLAVSVNSGIIDEFVAGLESKSTAGECGLDDALVGTLEAVNISSQPGITRLDNCCGP